MKKSIIMLTLAMFTASTANAQLGKLGKVLKDKAKEKVEQVKKDATDKAKEAAGVSTDNSGEPIIDDGTGSQTQFEKSPTEIDRERRAKVISDAAKPLYEKADAALKVLEEAVKSGNDEFVWDDPAAMDAKRALNECLEIKNFNRDEPTFVSLKKRYYNARVEAAEKADLLSGRPEMLSHMDRTADKDARLNDFYTLMNWYIKAADEAKYARQKEFIVAHACKDWRAFEYEKLMQYNNTTLTTLRKKLDSYRLNIPAEKSAKIAYKNAVAEPVDLYGVIFPISDYTNNDYTNDANVSPEMKKAMKEAEEYHAQYMREKADVEGLQSIKVSPNGTITCKYGNFRINNLNQIWDSQGNMIAKMQRYHGHYEVYTGPHMTVPRGQIYPQKDGTWVTFYSGSKGGKIEKDGTIYFMDQMITKVDLNQISPDWVCMIYFFKAFE